LLLLKSWHQWGTGLVAQAHAQENFRAVAWRDGAVVLMDQTRLPHEEIWLTLRTPDEVAHAIRTMQIRGAPAIGVALAAHEWDAHDTRMLIMHIAMRAEELRATRPTAVNLSWAIDRMMRVARATALAGPAALLAEVQAIADKDRAQSERMATYGAPLMPVGGVCIAPEGVTAANLAFDLTPADLITAIITDAGILRSPYREAIRVMADREATTAHAAD